MADNAAEVDKAILKQIKIKTGVVKRLTKEIDYYEKEAVQLLAKVEKMKAENADEHDVKKQKEVAQESEMMIPDSRRRLKAAIEDLRAVISGVSPTDSAMLANADYKTAQTVMQEGVVKAEST